jgi:hypothetical protein
LCKPAHQVIVERNLCWERVRDRLNRFEHIGKQFDIDELRKCSQSPPYYCHYMAWRLGTWHSDHLFENTDRLLDIGSALPNWKVERSILKNSEYSEYWSLLWQLQVAKTFAERGAAPAWNKRPDLVCKHDGATFYVECTSFRKSFGIREYMADLFSYIDSNIKVDHTWWLPFKLPQGKETNTFLDELFRPYLDRDFLLPLRRKAAMEYPVMLPVPSGAQNLRLLLEGRDVAAYRAGENAQGDPDNSLDIMIKEAVNNKLGKNNLSLRRPNALAVSFLVSPDVSIALERRTGLTNQLPEPNLGTELDAVLYSWCGIDEELDDHSVHVFVRDASHPLTQMFPSNWQRIAGNQ